MNEEYTLEQMMRDMEEDEAQVQGHPCCANCLYCQSNTPGKHYCEQGMREMTEEEEYDLVNIGCVRWRSDISGMPCEQ